MTNSTIKLIQQTIKGTRYENHVYVAGGFVRDHFMAHPSKDIDLVVDGHGIGGGIDFAWHLHRVLGTSKPVTFARFGTAQIVINSEEVEIVAARKEIYDFQTRNPVVTAGTIADDVNRRDFTINSILWNISSEAFVDLKGGINDIVKGVIRTTSDPKIIFAEDPLRIMRAIRFAAQLGFTIDSKTWNAVIEFVPWLKNISNERIRDEFNKILIAPNFVAGIEMLRDSGIMTYMVKEFAKVPAIQNQGKWHTKNLWAHTLEVVSNVPATVEHRLAALLHDIGKVNTMSIDESGVHFYGHQFHSQRIAKRFMENFKYTNEQIEHVTNSIFMHMNFVDEMLPKTIRKMVARYGKDQFLFFTDLGLADSKRPERKAVVQSVINFVETDKPVEVVKLPINGDMIMERFNLKPGKHIGELLLAERERLFENPEASVEELWEAIENAMN